MTKSATAPVTAATVREFFRADEKRMARLSPEAQRTVQEGAKGRLHAEAVKYFNSKRKAHRRYVLGATKAATEARASQRAALVKKGLAGARGPLSKEALASLSE